jgi:hypothetical protein
MKRKPYIAAPILWPYAYEGGLLWFALVLMNFAGKPFLFGRRVHEAKRVVWLLVNDRIFP